MSGSETSGERKRKRRKVTPALEQRVLRTYDRYPSLRATAKLVGLAHVTVRTILRENGIVSRASSRVMVREAHHDSSPGTGRIAEWLRRHQGKVVLRDYDHLATAIGVSKNALKCYFFRRRKEIKDALSDLPDLRTLNIVLRDSEGRDQTSKAISSYRYIIDRFSHDVWILGTMRSGAAVSFPIPDYRTFVRVIESLIPPAESREATGASGTYLPEPHTPEPSSRSTPESTQEEPTAS